MGFSAINSARSALSAILPVIQGKSIGEHPLVTRLMKGVRAKRPSLPRYKYTWDPSPVINYLKTGSESLKEKTLKLTMLLALVTGQRAQTLHALKISDMHSSESEISFIISSPLKTRDPGTTIHLSRFEQEELCIVRQVHQYLDMTEQIRKDDRLLISFVKPHKQVSCDTVRRWILTVMRSTGIDTTHFKSHSTRASSTSAAFRNKVPIAAVMKAGMWKNQNTFTKFYNRPVVEIDNQFSRAVLSQN